MIYIVVFFLSFILTYFIKNYAIKKSFVAEVNERSSHSTPTPHGGGIAIAITWFGGLFYLYFLNLIEPTLFYALMVGVIISMVSYMDDIVELSPQIRLLTQAFVATLALYFLGGFSELNFFFFTIENQFLTNIFAFFMIIWFINLYNFLDGIDGYAGSEAMFLALAGFFFFGDAHFLVLLASVAGFLLWNWHKAKIFMGDVGSTLLGFNVAVFTIYYANEEATNFWIWITLFGLFWFDATLTLFRRYKNGEKLSQAHKKHAYQRLTQSGFSHDRVVIAGIFVNIILFLVLFFLGASALSFGLSVIMLYVTVKYVDKQKGFL